jgi:hypothetical protein
MRLIWSGFLMVGLLLTGLSVYERREMPADQRISPALVSEDGTGFPNPNGTPRPK